MPCTRSKRPDQHFRATSLRRSDRDPVLLPRSIRRDYPTRRRERRFWWSVRRVIARSLAHRFFSCAGAMLVSSHNRCIDHHVLVIVIARHHLENPLANTAFGPSTEALMHRFPVTKPLRQGAPRTASSIAVEHGFDEQAIILCGAPTWPSRPGRKSLIRSHWSSRNP